ncbi:unnamed protein product [Cochlearia groenlandica]
MYSVTLGISKGWTIVWNAGQASSGIPVPVLVEYLFIPSASSYLRRIIPCLSPGRASAFYSYSLSAARP